jgi:hypothetical protein
MPHSPEISSHLASVPHTATSLGDVHANRKRPANPAFEIVLVPSRDGLPPGDLHPYRHMDEAEREALFVDSLLRILRDRAKAPQAESTLPASKESP